MPNSISFTSHGVQCHAWHFPAVDDRLATDAGRPAVVMAHGFAGTKDCGLESFAENLAASGADVLAFDYRGFGSSDGEPRQVISIPGQVEDYRAALTAAGGLPGVDARRLVLWGASMSGGLVLEVAAGRTDIAAVIALTPFVSGTATDRSADLPAAGGTAPSKSAKLAKTARMFLLAARDRRAAASGRDRVIVPAVGNPNDVALLTFPGYYDDYLSIAGPTWRNEVNASFVLDALRHKPIRFAAQLRCPTLFQIADFDRCVARDSAMKAAMDSRAQIRHYPGDHFDVYPGKRWHEAVLDHQSRFLTQTLAIPAPALTT